MAETNTPRDSRSDDKSSHLLPQHPLYTAMALEPPSTSLDYVALEDGGSTSLAPAATVPKSDYVATEGRGGSVPAILDMGLDDSDNKSVDSAQSVLTVDGIHDLSGFYCVCGVILIGDMSRGVMFPSMWPLVQSLGGSQVILGYAVASFSFGRVLVNPLFGHWSHTLGYFKTLLLATSILLIGTLVYAQIQNIGNVGALIFAQIILGVGSGTLGVTRAFVADVTAKRSRTKYMGLITAVQYGGFTVTPIFGAYFNYMLENKDFHVGLLRISMFTVPAYFMALVVLAVIVSLFLFFEDRHHNEVKQQSSGKISQRRHAIEEIANTPAFLGLSVFDCCILGCMLLNVSTKGSISSFETLGIVIAQSHFDMTSSAAGFVVAACGACGVVSLLHMGELERRFNDVTLITGGMVCMSSGIASLAAMQAGVHHAVWRYALAIFMIYSIGYPIGHTAVIGLFSKIVGRRPQGLLLGWFASAGSLARMVFPVMSGYIASYHSTGELFLILTAILVFTTGITLYYRTTLTVLST